MFSWIVMDVRTLPKRKSYKNEKMCERKRVRQSKEKRSTNKRENLWLVGESYQLYSQSSNRHTWYTWNGLNWIQLRIFRHFLRKYFGANWEQNKYSIKRYRIWPKLKLTRKCTQWQYKRIFIWLRNKLAVWFFFFGCRWHLLQSCYTMYIPSYVK